MRLKPEGGVTDISLHNAKELITERGLPDIIQLVNESEDASGHVVIASWGTVPEKDPFEHRFDGFSWGYGGQGPTGLSTLFKMIGLDHRVPINIIGKLPQDQHGLILSLARTGWIVEFVSDEAAKSADHRALKYIEGPSNL